MSCSGCFDFLLSIRPLISFQFDLFTHYPSFSPDLLIVRRLREHKQMPCVRR